MKHEFLQQVRENWRKVFCVIVGVAKTTTDSTIHMKTDVKGEEKIEPEGVSRTVVKGEWKVESEGVSKTAVKGEWKVEPEGVSRTAVKGERKVEPEMVSRTAVKGERKVEPIKYFGTSSSKLN